MTLEGAWSTNGVIGRGGWRGGCRHTFSKATYTKVCRRGLEGEAFVDGSSNAACTGSLRLGRNQKVFTLMDGHAVFGSLGCKGRAATV